MSDLGDLIEEDREFILSSAKQHELGALQGVTCTDNSVIYSFARGTIERSFPSRGETESRVLLRRKP